MQGSLSAIILDTTQLRPGTLPMLNGFGTFPYLRKVRRISLGMVWAIQTISHHLLKFNRFRRSLGIPSNYDIVAALSTSIRSRDFDGL